METAVEMGACSFIPLLSIPGHLNVLCICNQLIKACPISSYFTLLVFALLFVKFA